MYVRSRCTLIERGCGAGLARSSSIAAAFGTAISPGKLVGSFSVEAGDRDGATGRLVAEYADRITGCDYALITGPSGRVVWVYGG